MCRNAQFECTVRTRVEAAKNDRIWGVGIGVEEAQAGKKWRGCNILGEALMSVRAQLRGD